MLLNTQFFGYLFISINKRKCKRTFTSLSRISQLNMAGLAFLYSSIRLSTSGVATLGLLPPITPGRMLPVSWYRLRILDTQPCDTRSCRDMTHGRTPAAAISTIFNRMWLGSGRPLMNTPPSWFMRPWPDNKKKKPPRNRPIKICKITTNRRNRQK